jgi:POT family proton-dependent oligopeptide transporter
VHEFVRLQNRHRLWIGGFYERMSPAVFWALHAAIAATGGLAVALFGRRLSCVLESP